MTVGEFRKLYEGTRDHYEVELDEGGNLEELLSAKYLQVAKMIREEFHLEMLHSVYDCLELPPKSATLAEKFAQWLSETFPLPKP